MSRRTLERWRTWWLEAFPASRFWQSLRGRFMPAVDERGLPLAVLKRFDREHEVSPVAQMLRLLQPISTTPWLEARAS